MKYDLIAEAYIMLLVEGRIDDLKKQNPQMVDEIDRYVDVDPTPQKKFVPWLVSQHKKGNVTPHESALHNILVGFDAYKSKHMIKDHSVKSYGEIKSIIEPLIGTPKTRAEKTKQDIHSGINQIYSSDDGKVQAFQIKTKEASQHVYGGGKELGGLHTNWCVSARSNDCRFEKQYGKMYTIHVDDDKKSPYAVHPETNVITTRDNDGEDNIDIGLLINDNIKKLKPAIHAIQKHHDPVGFKLANSPHISSDEIDDVISGDSLHNKSQLFKNPNEDVLISALSHPKISENTLRWAMSHHNPKVVNAALNHPKLNKNYNSTNLETNT